MAEKRVQRRLAAVLVADVVGYSQMVETDEEGTLARLKQVRDALIEPEINEHGGRTVKLMGDGVLVEFLSAVDAVRCAIEVQRGMDEWNTELPDDKRIMFRIGINLGEIVIDGDDILGGGVNIAARLEGIAEPGGICVSGKVHEEVRGKIDIGFDDLGPQQVKNIAQPIQAYRIGVGSPALPREQAKSALPLPDKPSIAVLPFDNISNDPDPDQEYFADGLAEDIITALSRFRWFFVIARNSCFTYKGRTVDMRTVGQELGVRYLLEGSVRKGGNRIRITAQLIEAETGNHLWAERYDGALEDVFDLQDRITAGVVGAIEPSVRQAEIERAKRKRPERLDAYDLYLQALPHAWTWGPVEPEKAIELLDKALLIDPNYTAAHGLAAWCYTALTAVNPDRPRRSKALQHARAVLGPDTDDSLALAFAAFTLANLEREYDVALDAITRALALTPNSPIVLSRSALVNSFAGHFETAIDHAEASLRLSPFDPMRYDAEVAAANSYFFMGRYDEAGEAAQRCVHINPEFIPGFAMLAASRTSGGDDQAAKAAVERLLALRPDFRVGEYISVGRFAPELNKKFAAALIAAGLPE